MSIAERAPKFPGLSHSLFPHISPFPASPLCRGKCALLQGGFCKTKPGANLRSRCWAPTSPLSAPLPQVLTSWEEKLEHPGRESEDFPQCHWLLEILGISPFFFPSRYVASAWLYGKTLSFLVIALSPVLQYALLANWQEGVTHGNQRRHL